MQQQRYDNSAETKEKEVKLNIININYVMITHDYNDFNYPVQIKVSNIYSDKIYPSQKPAWFSHVSRGSGESYKSIFDCKFFFFFRLFTPNMRQGEYPI